MLQIPQHILDGLRCNLCNGYLSVKPLWVREENQQVCAKCFKTLSSDEKSKCVRQIGLEHIAVLLNFPCRYNVNGCGFQFKFNDKNTHEEECQYRYRTMKSSTTLDDKGGDIFIPNSFLNEIKLYSDEIQAAFSYEVKENAYSEDMRYLNYTLDIRGSCDNEILIKNICNYNQSKSVRLSLQGSVLLSEQPQSVYSNIKVIPSEPDANIYETLQRELFLDIFCCNCNAKITSNLNYCLLGHPSCHNCKELMCSKCVSMKANESNDFCKNYSRGCVEYLLQDERNNHFVNCVFNDYKCPVDSCQFADILSNLHQHLSTTHQETTYFTNEVARTFTQKDDIIIIVCFENIFKCKYYYYKSFIEFYVTLIGSSDWAKNYAYEITTLTNEGPVTKKASCSSWNNALIETGISFDKKDLISKTRKLSFDIKLKVIHVM